jgi:hypothetical protein
MAFLRAPAARHPVNGHTDLSANGTPLRTDSLYVMQGHGLRWHNDAARDDPGVAHVPASGPSTDGNASGSSQSRQQRQRSHPTRSFADVQHDIIRDHAAQSAAREARERD